VTARQILDPGTPIAIYKSVLTVKYADFTGRARRAEYWWFALMNFIVITAIAIVSLILYSVSDTLGVLGIVVYGVYVLAVIVPGLAVAVRRLHDTSKSGWMLLVGFIPLVGGILLLVFYFTDGDPGPNQHGPSQKYAA
jgi:uncharacterized membrane protein YhaH (DUF805 family)